MDDEVAQVPLHLNAAGFAPVAFERPPVEFSDGHERDDEKPAGQVQTVGFRP